MKRAVAVLFVALHELGVEGALLMIGTGCLAVFSSYVSPAGPWLVVGAMTATLGFIRLIVSLAVALQRRRAE